MKNSKTGLILEGGGMRGAFTSGVLDALLKHEMSFDNVYGVSAGASTGVSFISRQFERNKKVFVEGVDNYKYFSFKSFIKNKNFLNTELLFDTYPNNLIPFDYEAFKNSPTKFFAVTTDCITGKAAFFEKSSSDAKNFIMNILPASNSLPFISPPVKIDNSFHLDGGLSCSIPIEKSLNDGCDKNLIVLTREAGYIKTKSKLTRLTKSLYKKWPNLCQSIENRPFEYNQETKKCNTEMNKGNAVIIQPKDTFDVGRAESDSTKLRKLYNHGFELVEEKIEEIRKITQ
ncbi:MAG: patatin family protein [Spirochaetales bacterium]|nr:patatin family protein [Spirochaetales bacterium]